MEKDDHSRADYDPICTTSPRKGKVRPHSSRGQKLVWSIVPPSGRVGEELPGRKGPGERDGGVCEGGGGSSLIQCWLYFLDHSNVTKDVMYTGVYSVCWLSLMYNVYNVYTRPHVFDGSDWVFAFLPHISGSLFMSYLLLCA